MEASSLGCCAAHRVTAAAAGRTPCVRGGRRATVVGGFIHCASRAARRACARPSARTHATHAVPPFLLYRFPHTYVPVHAHTVAPTSRTDFVLSLESPQSLSFARPFQERTAFHTTRAHTHTHRRGLSVSTITHTGVIFAIAVRRRERKTYARRVRRRQGGTERVRVHGEGERGRGGGHTVRTTKSD